MQLEYSDLAQDDLEGIFAFTAKNWSLRQARLYLLEMRNAAQMLADGRAQGRLIPERPDVHLYRVKSHYLIFTVEDKLLKIRRILHVNMDTLAHI